MLNEYKSGNLSKLLPLVNRPPKWNEQVQAFVLNFYGRVDKPSVKNFQLVEEGGEDVILLQFGRVGEELFNLDFQYPFTPL
jgi:tubby-related protein 1